MAAPSGRCVLRHHWYRSGPAAKLTGRQRIFAPRFPGQFSVRPGSVEVTAAQGRLTHQGARMSRQQLSGATGYRRPEGQGLDQVHRWRAFAVLAVSFFMTVADLAIVTVALPPIGRK